ncbi:response regulator [Fulvimarina sp. MAC3]|uniref:response regulator n=1 Tax=Fulvimarina sp. MAC3 TaxID=3148887 RepID=UPI0031FC2BB2
MSMLEGRRVLLVEDESLIAMMAEDILFDLGCEVVLAMRLDQALTFVQKETFDFAVLDINLGDTRSYPVADLLLENGTPFIFATGYGLKGLDPNYGSIPVIQKPYIEADMADMLRRKLTGNSTFVELHRE